MLRRPSPTDRRWPAASLAAAVLLAGLAASSAGAQGTVDLSRFVGRWAAERGLVVSSVLEISLADDGSVVATYAPDLEYDGSEFVVGSASGSRLELLGADPSASPRARIVVELARGGAALRIIDGIDEDGGAVPRAALARRDGLWVLMRADFRDMGHEADGEGYPRAAFVRWRALVDAFRDGIRAAGGGAHLDSREECSCAYEMFAYDILLDGIAPLHERWRSPSDARALGDRMARAAGTERSLCDTTSQRDAASACARITITDPDGSTSVRTEPSSRSSLLGTITTGEERAIAERRGRWLRVDGAPAGWVFEPNTACVTTP